MAEFTRRALVSAVGVAVASAGCLSTPTGPAATDPTGTTDSTRTTDRTDTTETTDASDETTHPAGWYNTDEPDPDHAVTLRNQDDRAHAVRVRVVREATGETVFETTREVASGESTEVYNTRRADPEGSEAFRICAEPVATATTADAGPSTTNSTTTTANAGPTTAESDGGECATIRTNECYADVEIAVREGGSLQVIYAVC